MTAKTDVDLAPVVQKVDNAIKQWRMLAEALEEAVLQKIFKIEVLENEISSIPGPIQCVLMSHFTGLIKPPSPHRQTSS